MIYFEENVKFMEVKGIIKSINKFNPLMAMEEELRRSWLEDLKVLGNLICKL